MNERYYYVEEFCRYRQLMPVKYVKQVDEKWHKIGMACDNASTCGKSLEECSHFQKAPDIMSVNNLRERKIQ